MLWTFFMHNLTLCAPHKFVDIAARNVPKWKCIIKITLLFFLCTFSERSLLWHEFCQLFWWMWWTSLEIDWISCLVVWCEFHLDLPGCLAILHGIVKLVTLFFHLRLVADRGSQSQSFNKLFCFTCGCSMIFFNLLFFLSFLSLCCNPHSFDALSLRVSRK